MTFTVAPGGTGPFSYQWRKGGIAIPTATQIFCWIATLWTGRLHLKTPLLFVLGLTILAYVTLLEETDGRRRLLLAVGLGAAERVFEACGLEDRRVGRIPPRSGRRKQQVTAALKGLPSGIDVEIIEVHHRRKIDAPSGTALKS